MVGTIGIATCIAVHNQMPIKKDALMQSMPQQRNSQTMSFYKGTVRNRYVQLYDKLVSFVYKILTNIFFTYPIYTRHD